MSNQGNNFIIGNVVLVAALVFLLYMGQIWEAIGPSAMLIWMAMVGVGMTLLLKDKVD